MTTTAEATKVLNSLHHGWEAKTIVIVNGQKWQVTTLKRYNGALTSTAMRIRTEETKHGFTVTQFDSSNVFNTLTLITEKVRVTQNAVRSQHEKALLIFDAKIDSGEIVSEKHQTPVIGTIIFLDGYDSYKGSHGNNWIVYEVNGNSYKCVERDTLQLSTKDYVKNYANKFGIGSYFEPDFNFEGSADDLANLVIEAKTKQEQDQAKEIEKIEKQKAERLLKIEEGKKIVKIPGWAKSVIVAELYEDESDSQTDYFSASVIDRIFLAFSNNTRHNFQELKKSAALFPETEEFTNQEEPQKSCLYYQPDYFLGSRFVSGWKVSKEKYFDLTKEENKNRLYIAAAEGRYLISNVKEIKESVKKEGLNITLIQYSVNALAVIGETKEIKEQLKTLGGRFNKFLTVEGKKVAGWIFQNSKRSDLEKLI